MNTQEFSLAAPFDEILKRFKRTNRCSRCGNADSNKFKYPPPIAGNIIVECGHCGLSESKPIDGTRK